MSRSVTLDGLTVHTAKTSAEVIREDISVNICPSALTCHVPTDLVVSNVPSNFLEPVCA